MTSAYWRSLAPDFVTQVCPTVPGGACRVLADRGNWEMGAPARVASVASPDTTEMADWGCTFRFELQGPEQRYPLPVALGCCLAGVGAYGGGPDVAGAAPALSPQGPAGR